MASPLGLKLTYRWEYALVPVLLKAGAPIDFVLLPGLHAFLEVEGQVLHDSGDRGIVHVVAIVGELHHGFAAARTGSRPARLQIAAVVIGVRLQAIDDRLDTLEGHRILPVGLEQVALNHPLVLLIGLPVHAETHAPGGGVQIPDVGVKIGERAEVEHAGRVVGRESGNRVCPKPGRRFCRWAPRPSGIPVPSRFSLPVDALTWPPFVCCARLVITLIIPFTAFGPHITAPGPRTTSICSMSFIGTSMASQMTPENSGV